MVQTDRSLELRPLNIGEIFDRAISLSLQRFTIFGAIAAVVIVPEVALGLANLGAWSAWMQLFSHPAGKMSSLPPTSALAILLVVLYALVIVFGTPFTYAAASRALGELYRGNQTDWRSACGKTVGSVGAIIGLTITAAVLLFLGYLAGGLCLIIPVLLATAAHGFLPLALLFWALVAGCAVALLIVLALFVLSWSVGMSAIGDQRVGFIDALAMGFCRVFSKVEGKRSILFCLAFVAAQFALAIVVEGATLFATSIMHSALLAVAISSLVSLISTTFFGVLSAVYYFDLRVRHEGFDLSVGIDALPAPG